jgi:hypothetical protein
VASGAVRKPLVVADEMRRVLELFPECYWDRLVEVGADTRVYGWLPRSDGRRDFLLLDFTARDGRFSIGYTTSSAKFSEEIGRRLGFPASGHVPCKRVADVLYGRDGVPEVDRG